MSRKERNICSHLIEYSYPMDEAQITQPKIAVIIIWIVILIIYSYHCWLLHKIVTIFNGVDSMKGGLCLVNLQVSRKSDPMELRQQNTGGLLLLFCTKDGYWHTTKTSLFLRQQFQTCSKQRVSQRWWQRLVTKTGLSLNFQTRPRGATTFNLNITKTI